MRVGTSVALLALIAAPVVAEPAPIKVSVRQLLMTPKNYNGRRVDVAGFYRGRYEDSSLCPTAYAAANIQGSQKEIWVEADIYNKGYGNPPQSRKSPEYNFTGAYELSAHFAVVQSFAATLKRDPLVTKSPFTRSRLVMVTWAYSRVRSLTSLIFAR
jgi:hypothetical protein